MDYLRQCEAGDIWIYVHMDEHKDKYIYVYVSMYVSVCAHECVPVCVRNNIHVTTIMSEKRKRYYLTCLYERKENLNRGVQTIVKNIQEYFEPVHVKAAGDVFMATFLLLYLIIGFGASYKIYDILITLLTLVNTC